MGIDKIGNLTASVKEEQSLDYVNSKPAILDPLAFPQPSKFLPRRFTENEAPQVGAPIRHLACGAGTRACVGYRPANRLILGWRVKATDAVEIRPHTYNACSGLLVAEATN